MTEITETREQEIISDALAVIDQALGGMMNRELVSTDEVADLLLDVRSVLAADAARDPEPIAN